MAAMTAPKPKAKTDPAICRWGEGRYLSPKSARSCKAPKHAGRQLCDEHEQAFRKAKKATKPKVD